MEGYTRTQKEEGRRYLSIHTDTHKHIFNVYFCIASLLSLRPSLKESQNSKLQVLHTIQMETDFGC